MTPLTDTHPEVARRLAEAYRAMPPARKWKNLAQDYRMARALHATGFRSRNPGASPAALQGDWIAGTLGRPCPVPIAEQQMDPVDQDYQPVLRYTIRVLDRLRIGYAIGGSIASSLHGTGRMTRDADLTAEPFPRQLDAFVAAFDPADFYLSAESVREALRDRTTFNILHPATGYKIDVFVRKDEPFERAAFARRVPYPMPDAPDEPVQVHTAEDIVLFKIRWYRLGGEISDRQWNDILGVLAVQAGRLDDGYLDRWAADLGVADLLARARADAGPVGGVP